MPLKVSSNFQNFFGSEYSLTDQLSIDSCLATFDQKVSKLQLYIEDCEAQAHAKNNAMFPLGS